jgi:hypothetical protein
MAYYSWAQSSLPEASDVGLITVFQRRETVNLEAGKEQDGNGGEKQGFVLLHKYD